MSSKQLSELTMATIQADLRAGKSKRSTKLRHGVSYYRVEQISKDLYGAELSGAAKLSPPAARSPSRIDVAEGIHVDQGVAKTEPVLETVTNPDTGAQVDFMGLTKPIELEHETEYLVASQPILPSKQTGTKFDELAMQENPQIAEVMHNPPTAAPTQYTEDGRPFIRRRVEWHGHKLSTQPGTQIDGEPVTEEVGLDAARELPGWYEDSETGKRTYVIQYHPDTPEDLRMGEPDTIEATGKLPGGYEYQPTKGVIFRRHKTMTPEEWEQKKYQRNMNMLSEHFG